MRFVIDGVEYSDSDFKDIRREAERWRFAKVDPEGVAHLLGLLANGKGDADALDRMVDRIMTSYRVEATR